MSRCTLIPAAVAVLASVAACSDATGSAGRREVSVSIAAAPAAAPASASLALADAESPLEITKAQLVFSRTELEMADGACENDSHGDDCAEIESGPVLVDVPLGGSAQPLLLAALAPGAYHEFEVEIEAVEPGDTDDPAAVAAFLAAHPQFRGVSVRVEGTYAGEPFVFVTGVEAEMEFEFEPPLVVADAPHNITVAVDVASWFRRQDGTTIDPRTANQGGANKGLVDGNIERSFDVFEDDDRDGRHD